MKNAATADLLTRRQLLATATATATAMVANAWAIPPAAARQPRDHSSTLPSAATPQATGSTFPALAPFDTLMADFIHQQQVPGAQLAVSHRGRLVYARGLALRSLLRSVKDSEKMPMRGSGVRAAITFSGSGWKL